MGPTWVLPAPDGPHVDSMNLAMGLLWLINVKVQGEPLFIVRHFIEACCCGMSTCPSAVLVYNIPHGLTDISGISFLLVPRPEYSGTYVMFLMPWFLASLVYHQPWASCQIRKIAGAHAPGMPGTFSSPAQVSDPDMHYGTCVTHVPWCMPGSLTSGFLWSRPRGGSYPAFPKHAQLAILRIW